jgi:hypothetical protein
MQHVYKIGMSWNGSMQDDMKARTNVQVTLRMKRSMQDDMNGPLE